MGGAAGNRGVVVDTYDMAVDIAEILLSRGATVGEASKKTEVNDQAY